MRARLATYTAAIVIAISAMTGLRAQAPAQNPIAWSIAAAPNARPAAGRIVDVIVKAKIEPGWHLYSMSQPAGGPIAMSITLPREQVFSLGGKIAEPAPIKRVDRNFPQLGESLTFDDDVEFTVPVRVAAGTGAGVHPLRLEVEFQVCSDQWCLKPKTVGLKIDVTIGGR